MSDMYFNGCPSGERPGRSHGDRPRRASPGRVDKDTLFSALGHRYRRIVLTHLRRTRADPVPVGTLVSAIAAWEHELDHDTPPRDIEVSLRHAHLPKLADAGLIEFERDRSAVRYRENGLVERFLTLAARTSPLP